MLRQPIDHAFSLVLSNMHPQDVVRVPGSVNEDTQAGYLDTASHHETPVARYDGDVVGEGGLAEDGLITANYEGDVL